MLNTPLARNSRLAITLGVAVIACLVFPGPVTAQVTKVRMGTLGSPSVGSWIVAIMEARQFDIKNGIDIDWIEQPSTSALYNDFAAGTYPVASGGMITYANQYARGVKLKLFATYQLFGTSIVVNTERAPEIQALKDLNGKELAAPLASENYKTMSIHLMWSGVDLKSLKVKNFEHPGVAAELRSPAGTAHAGVMWAQLPTKLVTEDSKKFRDLVSTAELEKLWRQKTGTEHQWLLGVVANEEFARNNPAVLQRVHAAMKDTIDWFNANTEEALSLVAQKTREPIPVLRETVKAGRVKFLQATAESQEKAIMELLKISTQLGHVTKLPDAGFIYRGLR